MATRRSNSVSVAAPASAVKKVPAPRSRSTSHTSSQAGSKEYVTVPLEDRIRRLEKRQRVSDTNRAWQKSLLRKLTVSGCIYVTAALLFILMLTPGWFICAFVPVMGYWLSGMVLWLARDLWENTGK